MKVIKLCKLKKGANRYKDRCSVCNTKLLVDYADLQFTTGQVLDYHYECPICYHKQHLLRNNDKKMWVYRKYINQKWWREI